MSRIYQVGNLLADRYIIERFHDEGGMQEVYLATDRAFNRKVVVKAPKNSSAIKRFKRSAVLSAKVTHPNVAKTLDYFEHNGMSNLVEEYLAGGNLYDSLLGLVEALDPYLTAKLLHHITKGLAAAHHAEVVHRDLKPTNIMLAGSLDSFTPKITDFGVARMAEEALAEAWAAGEGSITASKTAVGHLPYMAPELIRKPREVRKSSDVWAIGALGYEMLSGQKPFGEGLVAVPAILENRLPSLPEFVQQSDEFRTLGKEIFDIVLLCLQADEASRPSADDLVALTSKLCYGQAPRKWGIVKRQLGGTGTIICDDGEEVFFHVDCVYGPRVQKDDRVLLASFPGNPLDRAQPIVRSRRDD